MVRGQRGQPALSDRPAGYDTEHAALEARGWRAVEWFRGGFLKGGMGNFEQGQGHQQHRERLWLSHCPALG